ncbi:MAG: methyltransferase domain-containing protein [Acidimicrobiales bacterium]
MAHHGDLPRGFASADAELVEVLDNLDGATNYLSWIIDLARPYLRPPILDFGAGHGTVTERLVAFGPVTALDVSPRCLAVLLDRFAGRDGVDIVGGVDALDDRRYGSIVLINVLEHIDDDVAILHELRDLLAPDGKVVLFVPAHRLLYSRFDRMIGHFRRYERSTLRATIGAAGLEPEVLRFVNPVGAVGWLVIAKLLGRVPTSPGAIRFFDRRAVPILRRLDRWVRLPFGQSIVCVARVAEAAPR